MHQKFRRCLFRQQMIILMGTVKEWQAQTHQHLQRSTDVQRRLSLKQSVATIYLMTRVWNGLKKLILQLKHERNLRTIVHEKDQEIQALLVGFDREKEAWRCEAEGVQESMRSVVQSLQDSNLEAFRKLEGVMHSLRVDSISLALSKCGSLYVSACSSFSLRLYRRNRRSCI